MPWLNPPVTLADPQAALPWHHDEPGVVWEAPDGTIWESTWTQNPEISGQGQAGEHLAVRWTRCHPERAELLKKKYAPA